jgi:hypothetical protein
VTVLIGASGMADADEAMEMSPRAARPRIANRFIVFLPAAHAAHGHNIPEPRWFRFHQNTRCTQRPIS